MHPEKMAVRYARGEKIRSPQRVRLLAHLAQCEQCNTMVLTVQEFIRGLREEGKLAKERPSVEAALRKAGVDPEHFGELVEQYFGRGPEAQESRLVTKGFRVNLKEIEDVLRQHGGVSDAVVVVREDSAGRRTLAAYVVSSEERRASTGELRGYLFNKLPKHMVPSNIVKLTKLPLTASGEVDRDTLPLPQNEYIQDAVENANALQRSLDEVKNELAAITPADLSDNTVRNFLSLVSDSKPFSSAEIEEWAKNLSPTRAKALSEYLKLRGSKWPYVARAPQKADALRERYEALRREIDQQMGSLSFGMVIGGRGESMPASDLWKFIAGLPASSEAVVLFLNDLFSLPPELVREYLALRKELFSTATKDTQSVTSPSQLEVAPTKK